jgi:hypothetical protein
MHNDPRNIFYRSDKKYSTGVHSYTSKCSYEKSQSLS